MYNRISMRQIQQQVPHHMKVSLDQYYVLFGKVRAAIISSYGDTLSEKLLYHWNNSSTQEKKAVVDDMLEKGTLRVSI